MRFGACLKRPAQAARKPRHAVRLRRARQSSPTRWCAPASLRAHHRSRLHRIDNLQRQVLFDEATRREPDRKRSGSAETAHRNSSVTVEAVVTDIDRTNILSCRRTPTLFSTAPTTSRFATSSTTSRSSSASVVYGGSIGSHGQTMTIVPG